MKLFNRGWSDTFPSKDGDYLVGEIYHMNESDSYIRYITVTIRRGKMFDEYEYEVPLLPNTFERVTIFKEIKGPRNSYKSEFTKRNNK